MKKKFSIDVIIAAVCSPGAAADLNRTGHIAQAGDGGTGS